MSDNHQNNRGNGPSGGGKGKSNNNNNRSYQNRFKGACEGLKDHVYTVGDARQADRYTKTTEQILSYILREYTQGRDVKTSLEELEAVDMIKYKPKEPHPRMSEVDKMVLAQEVKDYVTRKVTFEDNMNKAYALLLGQCSMGVKNKLESRKDWNNVKTNNDPILLLKAIKEITQDYEDSKYPIASIHKALVTLLTLKQEDKEGLASHTKRFKNAQDIVEAQHGKLPLDKYVEQMADYGEENNFDNELWEENTDQAYDSFIAHTFMVGADSKKSGKMLEDLANNFALGDDKYPKTLAGATDAISNYRAKVGTNSGNQNNRNSRRGNQNHRSNGANGGTENQTGFAQRGNNNNQRGNNTRNGNNNTGRRIICFACGEEGHCANACPKVNRNDNNTANAQTDEQSDTGGSETQTNEQSQARASQPQEGNQGSRTLRAPQFFQTATTTSPSIDLNMFAGRTDLKDSVLLDNQSTIDIFANFDYLTEIREVPETLNLYTNGGVLKCNTKGHLAGYGDVWCHKKAIANIISLSNAERTGKFSIEYKTGDKGFLMKNLETGKLTTFVKDRSGLHAAPLNPNVVMLNTVEENKSVHSKKQIARAEAARHLCQVIGYPSIADFKNVIQMNQIKNCPVTIEDINICEKIFGPDIYALKGKSVRKKPKVVVNDYVEIPPELIKAQQKVTMFADIMYIDGVPLLATLTENIRVATTTHLINKEAPTLMEALDAIFIKYNNASFIIKEFRADREFECLRDTLEEIGIEVNLCAAQEHVPEIERMVRVIKERYRAMYHRAPYSMWPKIMIIRGAADTVKWLNTFPP